MKKQTQVLLAILAAYGCTTVQRLAESTAAAPAYGSASADAGGAEPMLSVPVERDFRQLTNLVWRAVDDKVNAGKKPGDREYVDVTAMYVDRVIVRTQERWFSYPYTIEEGSDGVEMVKLASPMEVNQQYVPVNDGEPAQQTTEALGQAAFTEAKDGSIQVTLINAGASLNGNYYGDAVLKAAVPMFEGVRVFAKSDADHTSGKGKDVRNLIGGVYGVAFLEGRQADTGKLVGTFKAIDTKDAVVVKMVEAVKRGMQNLMGLSIDATAKIKNRTQGSKTLREATQFTRVNSVDLIVEPGAGGGLDRLTEAAADPLLTGENSMFKTRLYEAIVARAPDRAKTLDMASATDEQVMALYEAVMAAPAVAAATAVVKLTEADLGDAGAPVTRAELAMLQTRASAVRRISESKLPAPAKQRLTARFESEARFAEADVEGAIKFEAEYLGKFTESGSVRVPAYGAISVQDRSVVMADMLAAFFDPAHKDHKQVRSFKECYIEITGDKQVTGLARDVDMARMRESLGEQFYEAVASGTFANALGNSITRRMQEIYIGMTDLQSWRKLATVGSVNDFRTQERVRVGGYGNLPIVLESAGYVSLTSPSDERATYAVAKRGGTESVTLEAIKNDDVNAIRRIPLEMALAAANTINEFVFDFLRTNPLIYDATALFTVGHNNLFVGALSATEVSAHRIAMLKQTRFGSGKRLATMPKSIFVPFELQETAVNLFNRNTNLDKTFQQTLNMDVIAVPYWTDTNDWHLAADPAIMPMLGIDFLDGREDPELFVQDLPNVGSLFNNDMITYKMRHIYGGNILVDGFKGLTKAVVP